MDWDRVIYNGTVVNDDGMQRADIYIRDGRVAAVTSERLPGTVGETTDASGRYILPGLIETHVHSRDGRLATGEKEDFRSSTAAAAASTAQLNTLVNICFMVCLRFWDQNDT